MLMTNPRRRLRSVLLAAVLVTNGLPVAPLWGALTDSKMSCPQHGRDCGCTEKCARKAHEHPKPVERPKPACHREQDAPTPKVEEVEEAAQGCALKSCGPETDWTAAAGELRYLPDCALTGGLHTSSEGAGPLDNTIRFASLHSPPPVPPPQV